MTATLVFHRKIHLIHRESEAVAIAELKVWKVGKSKDFPEGIKYSMFLVWKETGNVIIGFDNHKPKGHHFHSGERQEHYEFLSVEILTDTFWAKVKEEGFII